MGNDLTTPSTGQRSVSPDAVDRLFQKFAAMYGKQWLEMWSGIPMDVIKAEWSRQLEYMPMEAIRLAVEHIERNNKFPPTLPELRALCEQFKPRKTPLMAIPDKRRGEIPQAFKDVLAKMRGK